MHDSANLLGLHDTDSDGALSRRELGFWLMENRRLNNQRQSDEVFDRLDGDGNTRVSYSEWQSNIQVVRDSVVGSMYARDEL